MRSKPPNIARKPPPTPDRVDRYDVEQRSDEWFAVRCGVITSSKFATVMASGKDGDASATRRDYLFRLAGERLTGQPAENDFENRAMRRGIEMEPAARAYYERTSGFVDLTPVGFIKRTVHKPLGDPLVVGCSPDSLVGKRKVLEIKTMRPDLLIALALRGAAGFPLEHRAQCQGSMWVAGCDECDLLCFWDGMPVNPKFLVERDDGYIKLIEEACETFAWELNQLVEKIQNMAPRSGDRHRSKDIVR